MKSNERIPRYDRDVVSFAEWLENARILGLLGSPVGIVVNETRFSKVRVTIIDKIAISSIDFHTTRHVPYLCIYVCMYAAGWKSLRIRINYFDRFFQRKRKLTKV